MELQHLYQQWNRWLSYLGLLFLSVTVSAVSALELTVDERAWLSEHPIIRVGIDPAWPPYEFLDAKGQHQGISADYLALIAPQLGVKFVVGAPEPWSKTQQKLEHKALDITPSITETPKRREFLNFTQPYLSFPVVILTRANEPFLTDLLSALSLGQVDYILTNHASASYAVQSLHITGLKLAAITPFNSPLSIGVRQDWPILITILNKALIEISPKQHQAIRDKWLGVHKSKNYIDDIWRAHPDIILLTVIVSFLVLVGLVVLYFRHRLIKL